MRCWNQLVCDVQLGRKCPGSRSDCKLVVGVMNHVSRVDAQNFFVADFAMPSSFGSKTVVALQKRKSTGMHLERVKMAEVEERAECMNGRLVESRRTVVAGGTVALGVCSCIVILDLCRSEEIPESHNAVHEAVEVEEAVGQKSWVGRWSGKPAAVFLGFGLHSRADTDCWSSHMRQVHMAEEHRRWHQKWRPWDW